MSDAFDAKAVLAMLVRGRTLAEPEAERLFAAILSGGLDDAQVAAALALIQARGPTADEVVGAARVMRRHVATVPRPADRQGPIIDTCGTGGTPKAFNVSTAAAIVAAAAAPGRVMVAKHGNRSRTGRGSAEVLAALGVAVDAGPEAQARALATAGVCFCFAIHHHPAMKHAAGPRRSLGFPTIFNILGPLTNPAGADRQLIGVYHESLVELVAAALARLGAVRAMVVHGRDGMDEISTVAPTLIAHVERTSTDRPASIRVTEFDARSVGLPRADRAALQADDLPAATDAVRRVLAGEPGPKRDIVELNAAAALIVAGLAEGWEQGLTLARAAIDSGRARCTLDALVAVR